MGRWPAPLLADYRVEVRTRVGGLNNARCRFDGGVIEAEFTRTLDDTSSAWVTVTAPTENDGCRDCRPVEWADELVFWRGDNPQPAWIGPIVSLTDTGAEFTIRAIDRSGLVGDRTASRNHPALGGALVDPGDLASWMLDEIDAQGPLGLEWHLHRDAAVGPVPAEVVAGDLLWDAFTDLAADAVDWTVVGPELHLGVPTMLHGTLPTLDTSKDWTEATATVERDAMGYASHVEVVGAAGVRAVYAGPAGPAARVYRPLRIVREGLTSQARAERMAQDLWADAQDPQLLIATGSASLSADCPITVEDLIPGRLLTVYRPGGVLPVAQQQRLVGCTVRCGSIVAGAGWALGELAVSIDLEPAAARQPVTA